MIPEYYMHLLQSLSLCKSVKERQQLLTVFCRDKKFVKVVKLICQNTISKEVPLTKDQQNKLKKYADKINKIGVSRKSTRTTIVQSGGGFISILLPVVASLIGGIINGTRS